VGYRCYSCVLAAFARGTGTAESTVLETPHHRITLDPETGSVRSWVDRASGREWIDATSGWRFNQHLYVTGADLLPNRLVQYSTVSPEPTLTVHAASERRLTEVLRYPWGIVAG
jgi:hypothetical protein